MKKHFLIVGVAVLFICVGLSGCNEKQPATTKGRLLFVDLNSGYEGSDYVYVDIQNIDSESGEFTVVFSFTYVDEESVGDGDYGGGTTGESDEGLEYKDTTIKSEITPQETERVKCPINTPDGYFLGSWDYEITAPYKG